MTSRNFQPGQVAIATVRGVPNVRIFRWVDVYGHLRWDSATLVDNECTHLDSQIVAARPLVVIDPDDEAQAEAIVKAFVAAGVWKVIPGDVTDLHGHRREQVAAALREYANPTPPKPTEPTGLGAVVEDDRGGLWIRTADPRFPWRIDYAPDNGGEATVWQYVNVVRVLSEGWSE